LPRNRVPARTGQRDHRNARPQRIACRAPAIIRVRVEGDVDSVVKREVFRAPALRDELQAIAICDVLSE